MKSNTNSEAHQKVDPYKKIARFYDRVFEPANSGLRNLGVRMYPPFEGMTVLDVGCGTGIHLERYQKAGCDVYGIDLSPSMLQVARKRLGERAHLFMGDASNMPYSNQTFDLILMTTVLHEMPEKARIAVINESKRILKRDGRILIIDFHPGPILGNLYHYSSDHLRNQTPMMQWDNMNLWRCRNARL